MIAIGATSALPTVGIDILAAAKEGAEKCDFDRFR